jgi:TAP-like protein
VGDEFRTEVVSQIPVVFTQGDWDTSTPVENVLSVAPYFPNSRVLIVARMGHGALEPMLEPLAGQLPDVFAMLREFVQTGRTANLPARVTLPAPKFGVPNFPPVSKPR